MDDTAQDAVRMLMGLHGLDAGDAECAVFEAMLGPAGEGVARLYAMEGIRYAEPAPIFSVAPCARSGLPPET